MTETLNVHDAKSRLSELLARVEKGEDFIIARAGSPVARLVAVERRRPKFGFMPEVSLPDHFFEPMSAEELALWEDGPIEP